VRAGYLAPLRAGSCRSAANQQTVSANCEPLMERFLSLGTGHDEFLCVALAANLQGIDSASCDACHNWAHSRCLVQARQPSRPSLASRWLVFLVESAARVISRIDLVRLAHRRAPGGDSLPGTATVHPQQKLSCDQVRIATSPRGRIR
jgi:hypothetical protein